MASNSSVHRNGQGGRRKNNPLEEHIQAMKIDPVQERYLIVEIVK